MQWAVYSVQCTVCSVQCVFVVHSASYSAVHGEVDSGIHSQGFIWSVWRDQANFPPLNWVCGRGGDKSIPSIGLGVWTGRGQVNSLH